MSNSFTSRKEVDLRITFTRFALPPVQDALVIGKNALVGVNGIERAFQELMPGLYKMIRLEHPVIEGILVRESDLRKMPEEKLIEAIVRHVEPLMDASDALHVTLDVEICVEERGIPLS